jgi:hypothetical protein
MSLRGRSEEQSQIENFKFQIRQSLAMGRGWMNCGNEVCAGEAAQAVARCAVLNSQSFRTGLTCAAPTALNGFPWRKREHSKFENFGFQMSAKTKIGGRKSRQGALRSSG